MRCLPLLTRSSRSVGVSSERAIRLGVADSAKHSAKSEGNPERSAQGEGFQSNFRLADQPDTIRRASLP